jgi:hypothetical protein
MPSIVRVSVKLFSTEQKQSLSKNITYRAREEKMPNCKIPPPPQINAFFGGRGVIIKKKR